MRVIIAGSRDITDYIEVYQAIKDSGWMNDIEVVLCGGAKGPDELGKQWALENIGEQGVEMYLANWAKYGKSAGFIRNQDMAMDADALITVWDGKSKGTKHMINIANEMELEVFIRRVKIDG